MSIVFLLFARIERDRRREPTRGSVSPDSGNLSGLMEEEPWTQGARLCLLVEKFCGVRNGLRRRGVPRSRPDESKSTEHAASYSRETRAWKEDAASFRPLKSYTRAFLELHRELRRGYAFTAAEASGER